jgi:hypothetical protein
VLANWILNAAKYSNPAAGFYFEFCLPLAGFKIAARSGISIVVIGNAGRVTHWPPNVDVNLGGRAAGAG